MQVKIISDKQTLGEIAGQHAGNSIRSAIKEKGTARVIAATGASQFEQPIGAVSAAAVVVTIPIIIMVLIFQRRIVAGLTAGAVKG